MSECKGAVCAAQGRHTTPIKDRDPRLVELADQLTALAVAWEQKAGTGPGGAAVETSGGSVLLTSGQVRRVATYILDHGAANLPPDLVAVCARLRVNNAAELEYLLRPACGEPKCELELAVLAALVRDRALASDKRKEPPQQSEASRCYAHRLTAKPASGAWPSPPAEDLRAAVCMQRESSVAAATHRAARQRRDTQSAIYRPVPAAQQPELRRMLAWSIAEARRALTAPRERSFEEQREVAAVLAMLDRMAAALPDMALALTDETSFHAAIAYLPVDGVPRNIFVFPPHFASRFYGDPQMVAGYVLHELCHADDYQRSNFNGSVLTSKIESSADWVRGVYWRELRAQGPIAHEEGRRLVEAMKDGPDSQRWRDHLDELEQRDFELLDILEKAAEMSERLPPAELHRPFTDILLRDDIGGACLEKARSLERDLESNAAVDPATLRERFRFLETYLLGANKIYDVMRARRGEMVPTREGGEAGLRWLPLHRELLAIRTAILENPAWLAKCGVRPRGSVGAPCLDAGKEALAAWVARYGCE